MAELNGLRYMGGKYYIADWIISHFDYSVPCYVELFGGAGHILFNKPPHKVEIFNDIDDELISFFETLRKDGDRLIEELEKLVYSEKIFYDFVKSNPETEFEKAVKWFYITRCSFSGCRESFSSSFRRSPAMDYHSSLDRLRFLRERIKNVQIRNTDYRILLNGIMRNNDVLVYADPPYFGVNYYKVSWSKDDHIELANYLNNLNCKVALSYYYFDGIEELYPKNKWIYNQKEIMKSSYYIAFKGVEKRPIATELLLTNYRKGGLL